MKFVVYASHFHINLIAYCVVMCDLLGVSLKLSMSTWLYFAVVATHQFMTDVRLNNISMPNTAWPSVDIIVWR